MANRSRQTNGVPIGSEIDFEFSLSQQSSESDAQQDRVLRETLEKCLAVEAEKKRAQKEKKFLQIAETHLNAQLERSARDIRETMTVIDEIYAVFLLEYAACEDRIQKKMIQLQDLQNSLVSLVKEGQKLDEVANKASGITQVEGLSKTRAACIAFGKILAQLRIPASENLGNEI